MRTGERRVVVTGMGIVSCLGNELDLVAQALRLGHSGIAFMPEYAELGLYTRVAGVPDISSEPSVDRKLRRFMGDAALYAHHAMRKAVRDAALSDSVLHSERTGLVVGSGVGSPYEHLQAIDTLRMRGLGKVPPYAVPRIMGNTVSACLSTFFGIRGTSYSITSACASSAHCIGHAAELIRFGKQEVVVTGGAEEIRWTSTAPFDAMGVLSTARGNSTASRPFDAERDGFVIAGGAGILILEELEHAKKRGAHIYAELVGYGASSDGTDMVSPSVEGAMRAMQLALAEADMETVDYLNAHATSTKVGDISELHSIRAAFGERVPLISSTKGLTGHPIAAAGAHEAIYSLLMLGRDFLAGCAHIDTPDPAIEDLPVLMQTRLQAVDSVMSNSFGFGGTNASLIFRRYAD